ncbi:MAG: carbamoyl phosphate synthase small subunit [Nitrospinae bacterium RIFCSPLOWO2_02_FULL_39_110]|nr:MAG: carbamoyl phosphate synthase small subunit [Nitrospinae bacterium RIFCSPHIGHO2_02_39_11]OGV98963.1 MAG: carbamoyl phosphate synthase small subunit [Nitrospinae bacterium RIFCSPHIGHO2_12_FULL_39_42]OGW01140.1 MAG: carbamoyl phosphate synthase small subunit [Nitrospinae bacterium RIFCSPHIGHO2_02_FULL_39_82]OGW04821.1 MAG: carbamoyl phosphate synthase small subunit [Nitrospinae bacterium RIFCSPLOWO2_02_FULL_39_110]OGW06869.1 MAG: carbamoyl phosphate synthase small subunit [Nitrospinae bact
MAKAILALSDRTIFEGESFGAEGEAKGEVVFNTSMSGYQEILTDPSYKGQIITMTYPLIGNYGVNEEDVESAKPQAEGFIIKEGSKSISNWRGQKSLDEYLRDYNIVGIQGIDTRALTKHIRDKGAQEGIISTIDLNPTSLIKKAKESPSMVGRDLVKEVTCHEKYHWTEGGWDSKNSKLTTHYYGYPENSKLKVVAYDCGIKHNILRLLVDVGCDVTVVPAFTGSDKVMSMNPDGIFLSNGPGDPDAVPYMAENIRGLIGKKPIFGICLGHQILCLSMGAKTYKLKFGHRGANHPVMDLTTRKVEITAQNHGFAVAADSLPSELELTHINLNDRTVEGVRHKSLPIFSVQYHPEASPGPHDSRYLFNRFVEYMRTSS